MKPESMWRSLVEEQNVRLTKQKIMEDTIKNHNNAKYKKTNAEFIQQKKQTIKKNKTGQPQYTFTHTKKYMQITDPHGNVSKHNYLVEQKNKVPYTYVAPPKFISQGEVLEQYLTMAN